MAETTPGHDLPYPEPTDDNNPPADIQALAERLEVVLADLVVERLTVVKYGALATGPLPLRIPVLGGTFDIVSVDARLGTPPGFGTVATVLDVNKNGTTIFTTQANRPTFASHSGGFVTGDPDATVGTWAVVSVTTGDIITVDVDAKGDGAAADLVVTIRLRRTA